MNIGIVSGSIIYLGKLSYKEGIAFLEIIVRTDSPHPGRGQSLRVTLSGKFAATADMWVKKDDWVCLAGMYEFPNKVQRGILHVGDDIPFSSIKSSPNRRPLKRCFTRFMDELGDTNYEFYR